MQGKCDLCGQSNKIIIGTPFTDCFCKECLQLVISECENGIEQIEKEEDNLSNSF